MWLRFIVHLPITSSLSAVFIIIIIIIGEWIILFHKIYFPGSPAWRLAHGPLMGAKTSLLDESSLPLPVKSFRYPIWDQQSSLNNCLFLHLAGLIFVFLSNENIFTILLRRGQIYLIRHHGRNRLDFCLVVSRTDLWTLIYEQFANKRIAGKVLKTTILHILIK